MGSLSRCLVLALVLVASSMSMAQDIVPAMPKTATPAVEVDTATVWGLMDKTLQLFDVSLPDAFQNVRDEAIIDASACLAPFWNKLESVLCGRSDDTLHVFQIGDSHIRGHYYPEAVAELFAESTETMVQYEHYGINGATCASFNTPENIDLIAAAKPDLLVISFGTNEGHSRAYSASVHYQQMESFVRNIRSVMHDVPILFTTPPGSYERSGRYRINPRMASAAATIVKFAADYHAAVWNLYEACGGRTRACLNWYDAHLMQRDRIHFVAEGYVLQGHLLYQAIAKSFNNYVESD